MAKQLDDQQLKRMKNAAQRARQRKIVAQKKLGKGTDFTDHHPGVIPEPVWQDIKKESNERIAAEGSDASEGIA